MSTLFLLVTHALELYIAFFVLFIVHFVAIFFSLVTLGLLSGFFIRTFYQR